jgi:hypothetical protein
MHCEEQQSGGLLLTELMIKVIRVFTSSSIDRSLRKYTLKFDLAQNPERLR